MEKNLIRGILLGLAVGAVLFLSYSYFSRPPSPEERHYPADTNFSRPLSPEERHYPADTIWLIEKIDGVNGKTLSPEQLATVESTFTGKSVVVVVFDEEGRRIRRKISLVNGTLAVTQESSAEAEIRLTDDAVHELRPIVEKALEDHVLTVGEKAEIIKQVVKLRAQRQILIEEAFLEKLIKDKTIDTLKSFVS